MVGAYRAQGAEVELPSIGEARAQFDEWLLNDDGGAVAADDRLLMRALGLTGGG